MVTEAAPAMRRAVATGTAAAALLRAEHLRSSYGTHAVVDDVSFELNQGEVLALVGPNGAGKSTLFRLLLQLERADSGRVMLHGRELQSGDLEARRRMSAVFQHAILFRGTVRDNVAFGLRGLSRAERDRRVDHALTWFGLDSLARADVRSLSGGEAQRVALTRALVLEPDVLLLDEPSAGLDVTVRARFMHELQRVARQHARGILLITHDPRDAFGLADRIAIMHHGRIVQIGTPTDIMLNPATVFAAELTGAELLLNGVVTAIDDTLATVVLPSGARLYGTIAAGEALVPGDAAQVAYRPEDVVIALQDDANTSAVNRLVMRVLALTVARGHVRVQLRGADALGPEQSDDYVLNALLTRRSVTELGIAPGTRVYAQLKASALHVWRSADSRHERA